jgi:hypothetical protein
MLKFVINGYVVYTLFSTVAGANEISMKNIPYREWLHQMKEVTINLGERLESSGIVNTVLERQMQKLYNILNRVSNIDSEELSNTGMQNVMTIITYLETKLNQLLPQ